MHHFYKLSWVLRAVFFKPFFARLGFPSYIGPPAFLMNTRQMHIGKRVRIFPGLRVECHGRGRLFIRDNVAPLVRACI